MSLRLHRIFGPGSRLQLTDESERKPVWIQAAVEGKWRGHPAHDVIEFTPAVFETVIANHRANPAFKPGPDGYGAAPVVRLDYEHLSEMKPTDVPGAPERGVPAPGWVLDLEMRSGKEGQVELWALVEMGEVLWEQVKERQYRWTSVAIDPHAKDRVSGKPIGPTMTSLAVTNNPFILGMEPMTVAATNKVAATAGFGGACLYEMPGQNGTAARPILCAMDVWGQAENAEEATFGLRDIFGLPSDAEPAHVLVELERFASMLVEGNVPQGVDAEVLVCRLRSLLGLRTLASREEILEEAMRVIASQVLDDTAPPAGEGEGETVEPPQQFSLPKGGSNKNVTTRRVIRGPAAQSTGATMSAKTLNSRLAPSLKLRADADDDAVVDAVKQSLSFRGRLLSVFKLSSDASDDELVKAAEEAEEAEVKLEQSEEKLEKAEEAKSAIDDLLELFGASSTQDLLTRAAKLTEEAKRVEPLLNALNEATKIMQNDAEKEAEEEVEAIAATFKLDDKVKTLLSNQRKSFIKLTADEKLPGVQVVTVDKKGLEKFRTDWPLPSGAERRVLASNVVAGPNGVQLGGRLTDAPDTRPLPPSSNGGSLQPTNELRQKIALCAGRNDIEKAMAYLSSQVPGFADQHRSDQVRIANSVLKTGQLPA